MIINIESKPIIV